MLSPVRYSLHRSSGSVAARYVVISFIYLLVTSNAGLAQEPEEVLDTVPVPVVLGQHLQESSEWWRNMPAADLQPSWNDPTVMVEVANLNLLTTEQAKERMSIFERLRAPQANTEGLSVALHTVPTDSFTVVGERGGITYAAWKDGPAGNMPIKHYYEVHDTEKDVTVSADFKAVLRRSSKIWSKHLVDDGLRHDVTLLDGTVAKNISGIVLQTRLNDKGRNSAWVLGYHGKDGNGYRPYNGKITISLHLHDDLSDWIADTVAHEIGHVLGITRKGTELYEGTYYDVESHTWNGPNVLRETNGNLFHYNGYR